MSIRRIIPPDDPSLSVVSANGGKSGLGNGTGLFVPPNDGLAPGPKVALGALNGLPGSYHILIWPFPTNPELKKEADVPKLTWTL